MSSEGTVQVVGDVGPALPCGVQDAPVVIKVEEVGKCYEVFARPRDRLWRGLGGALGGRGKEFWALQGVSMEVRRGETVGIIGRNGSGKSTLLQMICGTLALTRGRVETRGRVAALLELGAGFHPEFTGRENVFLNGRLLGVGRREVAARFGRIAEFAEIGEFMEMPVKTYSSGMYVRLAFAVAAHVDAEILVMDEALAVGDAFFQHKCMRFLREFRKRGSVLFVSHDPAAVVSLCDRAVWLEGGKVRQTGPAKAVCEAYFGAVAEERNRLRGGGGGETAVTALRAGAESMGEGGAEIVGVDLRDAAGREVRMVEGGVGGGGSGGVELRVRVRAGRGVARPIVGFYVNDKLGQKLFGQNTAGEEAGQGGRMAAGEERVATFAFDMPRLRPGSYTITVAVAEGTMASHTYHHWVHDAYAFTVAGVDDGAAGLVGIKMTRVEFRAVRGDGS